MGQMHRSTRRSGFVWAEAAAVGAVAGVAALLLMPVLHASRMGAQERECATRVGSAIEALQQYAGGNRGNYPVPAEIDRRNRTLVNIAGKDRPSHAMSILIYNGFITTRTVACPGEQDPSFQLKQDYRMSNPGFTVVPEQAQWDPTFRATRNEPLVSGGGVHSAAGMSAPYGYFNLSYAITPFPMAGHAGKWRDGGSDTQAVLGDRGPAYDSTGSAASLTWYLHQNLANDSMNGLTRMGTGSYTWRTHGLLRTQTWRGNVAFSDGHVAFAESPTPRAYPYRFSLIAQPGGTRPMTLPDNLFVNEHSEYRFSRTTVEGTDEWNDWFWNFNTNYLRNWSGGVWQQTFPQPGRYTALTYWFD